LHRTYISDIERGARNVSLESIEKLARALDVSVATLFAHTEALGQTQSPQAGRFEGEVLDILFVEDNPDDVQLALRALKTANIANRIHVVRDGAEALNFLFPSGTSAHRDRNGAPQLILLDLNLPKVNGLDVLRRIKADARTRSIPVIVLTGSNQDRDIAASKRLGANAYIVKPVDFQSLSEVTPQLSLHWALLKPALPPSSAQLAAP
jgi:CheY-like chemotaxis protein